MNRFGLEVDSPFDIRRRVRGRTIKGGQRGVSEDSPRFKFKDLNASLKQGNGTISLR